MSGLHCGILLVGEGEECRHGCVPAAEALEGAYARKAERPNGRQMAAGWSSEMCIGRPGRAALGERPACADVSAGQSRCAGQGADCEGRMKPLRYPGELRAREGIGATSRSRLRDSIVSGCQVQQPKKPAGGRAVGSY